jgi:hypothetical protein
MTTKPYYLRNGVGVPQTVRPVLDEAKNEGTTTTCRPRGRVLLLAEQLGGAV